jgi:hypothetical protein
MTTISKFLAAAAVMASMVTTEADAGPVVVGGYRYASPSGHGYIRWDHRRAYVASRFYTPQQPDLGAAIAGALAGAALQLIPRAAGALISKLPPADSTPPPAPPVVAAQLDGSPPSGDVLDDIEGNSRGITRQEVEAALVDWCATHGDAPLCVKLRVNPPPLGSFNPSYAPPSQIGKMRDYYDPRLHPYGPAVAVEPGGRCPSNYVIRRGMCRPYRGY